MKYRAINARTREPVGADFDAPEYSAAKVVGAMREDQFTRVIVYELPSEARPVQAVQASMPITEGDRAFMGVDQAVPGRDKTVVVFSFGDIERLVEKWLDSNLLLPGGYRLVPHVHRGMRENLAGKWEVSFILVSPKPEKHAPENGSSPGLPEGASRKDAG